MFKKEEFTNTTDILIAPELAFAIPCIVSNTGVDAVDGKKIIKAGTPLYCEENVFKNRQKEMTVSGTTLYGIARWDIDVTDSEKTNATLLVSGYVDYLKLDSTVQSTIDSKEEELTRILFIKGRKL